jgi:hypothetical protein
MGVAAVAVPLSGAGQLTAGMNISPAQLAFPAMPVGAASTAQTVTLSNTSNYSIGAVALGTTGPFSLTQNTCAGGIAAGASCTVGVVFTPIAAGTATGTLTASSSSVATAATVALSGVGAVPVGIQVTPASINFVATGAGATSAQSTVVVMNPGTAGTLNNLVLAVPAGFALVNNGCGTAAAPGMLGAGASCTAGVVFAPTSAGTLTGSLTVTSTSVATVASVPLTGMGFDFTVAASGSSTQSVASGQTANYGLVLTPMDGSSGTFTFRCGTLPANASCAFNPATETLTAGTTGNVTVEIATGTAAVAREGGGGNWRFVPLACVLVLLPLGWRGRRKAIWFVFLLGLLAGSVTSCTSS